LGRKAIPVVFSKTGAKLALRKVQLMEASEQKRSLSGGLNTTGYEHKAFLIEDEILSFKGVGFSSQALIIQKPIRRIFLSKNDLFSNRYFAS
jgi:hypothetical protein